MQGNERDDLYRLPNDDNIPLEEMRHEEVEFRRLLAKLVSEPNDEATLLRVAEILMSQKLYQEADLYLERYLALRPDDPTALNWAGVAAFTRGDYENAESFYEQAITSDREHPDTLYNLAMLHAAQGNFDKARACFEKLVDIEKENPEVFNNLGALLYEAGEIQEAEAKFRQALELNPAHLPALDNILQILRDEGRDAEAEEVMEAYKNTDPPNDELDRVLAGLDQESFSSNQAGFPELSPPSVTENALPVGLTVGIISDWCPGDRGDLGMWIRTSLEQNGHQPHVLARTGSEPHCKGNDRSTPPRTLGPWVVPNLTHALDAPLNPDIFDEWLVRVNPDAVIFIDESHPDLVDKVHAAGAVAIACPALVGAKSKTASSLSIFDSIIALSPWINDVLKERVPEERLIPCDFGIDLDTYTPSSRCGKETVFLYDGGHGSVEDLENFLSMLTAFGMMNREAAENSRLLVRTHVDWYNFPEEIRKRGENNPRIDVISGHVDDRLFLRMGDVLVQLKTSPGIHSIVPKAAACGTPSIVLDKSPSTGWIIDEHMILKIPCDPGMGYEGMGRTGDIKTLSDTMCTLAIDQEMVEYMGGICREKARQVLDGVERGSVFSEKILTAHAAWKDGMSPAAADGQVYWTDRQAAWERPQRIGQAPEELLNAIEEAITSGQNDQARELMSLYRQNMD